MKLTPSKTPSQSFYFYKNENKFERSTLKSFAIKKNTTLFAKKYRLQTDIYKEEKRTWGKLLPSTLLKPQLPSSNTTYSSKSFNTKTKLQLDLFLHLNSLYFTK